MFSDIYKACEEGDVNLVRILIETSPSTVDINRVEPNGSTVLGLALEKGYTEIVQLLLEENYVGQVQQGNSSHTTHQTSASTSHEHSDRPSDQSNPFCTDANFQNPFQTINRNNPDWLKFHSNSSSIVIAALGNYTVGGFPVPHNGYIHNIKRFLGFDPDKKKIEEWSKHLQCFLDKHLPNSFVTHSEASECVRDYKETRKIEHLLRLYTVHTDICKYLVQDKENCDYLYAAIYLNLPNVSERAYKGSCYRGLTMTENDFQDYRRALENKGSYLGMNKFSSTSIERRVAERFVSRSSDQLKVLLVINFTQRCPMAISLYERGPDLPLISAFRSEKEVLILPGTIFSVTKIEENSNPGLRIIHLEYYDPSDEVGEIMQERFEGFIENMLD